jgi:peptide-methionine (S)-S-oxide reductase
MSGERQRTYVGRMRWPSISTCCLLLLLAAVGCRQSESAQSVAAATTVTVAQTAVDSPRRVSVGNAAGAPATAWRSTRDTAMFAGGCFWSMERPFQHMPGVLSTTSGYAGGHTTNPTYEQVNTGTTGHTETVLVEYDPSKVTYEQLLDVYWHNIDPITKDRQFCDRGSDYRTVIFTHGAAQNAAALRSRAALDRSGHFTSPVVTEVVADAPFWRAEEYHQHFADRNPVRYDLYRRGCGRDARLHELWGNAASPYVPAH